MRALKINVGKEPEEIEIEPDERGSYLKALQGLVGGLIEPFNVLFKDDLCLYVNEEGLFTCPPNRAIMATKSMIKEGYVSQYDSKPLLSEQDLYSILFGPIVVVAYDSDGEVRDITEAEASEVVQYFSRAPFACIKDDALVLVDPAAFQ